MVVSAGHLALGVRVERVWSRSGGIRWEKVASVRAALASGHYRVSAGELAEVLLREAVVAGSESRLRVKLR